MRKIPALIFCSAASRAVRSAMAFLQITKTTTIQG